MPRTSFTIAAVERDVGLSKDVLRVWERRYGFPAPERDAHGERLYPAAQVERLRLIKRLMDQGHRPGRLLAAGPAELRALASSRRVGHAAAPADDAQEALVSLVREHRAEAFTQALQQRLAREGLHRFVLDTVAPLTQRVGQAWADGRLQVFEEHLFTELVTRVLRQALAAVPAGREPCVLLTSVPGEAHAMGLLMAEAMLSLEGARCVSLGTEMPLLEIARAAVAHRADIVALSFSSSFPRRQVTELLRQLRAALPGPTQLWAGGAGLNRVPAQEGVLFVRALEEASAALAAWHAAR